MCFGVFREGTDVRSQLSKKDLSMKDLGEHPRRTETPMPERGGPRHPCRGIGIIEKQDE